MSKSNSEQKPTLMPPANLQSKNVASDKTTPMENTSIASVEIKKGKNGSGKDHLSPSMPPPSTAKSEAAKTGEAVVSGVTVWSPAATINALWCINQDKNAWFGDAALGWKKLSTASESGLVALNMLSCHAKQKGSTVYYRTEDDNMVHEMYVW
jgi:hypothetical protein